MILADKHKKVLTEAIEAIHKRDFYSPFPEHPRAYPETADEEGRTKFGQMMNNEFTELGLNSDHWIGEEVSPYLQTGIGISYPQLSVEELINNANNAKSWKNVSIENRAGILIESLYRVEKRYFDIAYATMHTTGQSFMMAFQASGPHANDRALEAIAMGYHEISRFPNQVDWVKPMGKFDLTLHKTWKAVPKGIGLVIGCSTFPTWNTVPGMYASLITGNPVIVKPHPKAILPIAIVIAELRKVFVENNLDPNIVQMAVDTMNNPITKELAVADKIKLIDYTGGSLFGDYIESLNKTTFTEKAGVNSVIIDSVKDLNLVAQNIAFASSLYSGQMCTAPQNIFVSGEGVETENGMVTFDEVANAIANAVSGLVSHPKMGAGTLGGIQNDNTIKRIADSGDFGGKVLLEKQDVVNPEFENARIYSPKVIATDADNFEAFGHECFGPIIFIVKTKNREHSVEIAAEMAKTKGAITCSAYCTDEKMVNHIEEIMNNTFTPVSFNFGGAAFVNQHAAFSDFHVTGGNPSGNASFTNPEYINKRFVWVGNRFMK
ncbi:MAG: phenylacetic acid degradation protein PaaN [Flavobacteriales bacterium]|nr:phenylacetic acid degradation protein PaaN [Flavobacteriales bacterium]